MSWCVTGTIMDKRIEFILKSLEKGANFSRLCREFQISRPTGYRWKNRYKAVGNFTELKEKSRRPHHSPNRTPVAVETLVLEEWEKWGDGAKKIQHQLAQQGIDLSWLTVHRILKRHNKVGPASSGKAATQRFERSQPNELWQMDFKGDYPVKGGRCYPLSILDDHSRFAVGLYGLGNQKGDGVWTHLVRTFEEYGVPQAMLMDHGTPWWSTTNGHGLTWLAVKLIQQGIRLYFSRVRHPQTQGKVERFHRSLHRAVCHRGRPSVLKEWQPLLDEFRTMYNGERPHEALGMDVPALRFSPSPQAYAPQPPAWDYPAGSHVTRVTPSGWMSYKGYSAFVCEALAGEWIQIIEADRLLLVRYRHLFVREIDRHTHSSRPLVLNEQSVNAKIPPPPP